MRASPWAGLAALCLTAVAISINYTNHGPLLGLIAAEFQLSAAEVGWVAAAFFLGAASTMLFGGALADRYGARRVLTLGFALVVVSNLASGALAPSFPWLLAWRAIGGIGSGSAFAAGASYARGIFADRGSGAHLAQGFYGASFLLGSGSTLLLMPLLAGAGAAAGEPRDWRRAFVLSGLGVMLVWLAWLRFAPPGPTPSRARLGSGLGAAASARNTWLLALCHTCGFGLAMLVSTWATTYLMVGFGLPIEVAGALGSLLLVTGIGARTAGGVILERGLPPRRVIQGALVLAAVGLLLMAFPAGLLPVALLGLLVTGFGVGLPYAAVFNGAAASVPRSPASAQALVGWGGTWVTIFGPPLVGALLDLTGGFSLGFTALAAFALLVLASTTLLEPFGFRTDAVPLRRPAVGSEASP